VKQFDKWMMPDHEEHLQEWMNTVGDRQHGRLVYQGHKYRAALQYVKDRRRAIDIGTHIGLWSFQMVHDFNKIEAFEPMPAHRECWVQNIGNVFDPKLCELHSYALGADERTVYVRTRTPNSSGDTGVEPMDTGVEGDSSAVKVQQRPLDSFGFADVDFIKIDCEGYELFVLQGAVETLMRCRPCVIVEQKPETGGPERYGIGEIDAVHFLESLGAKRRDGIQGDYILSW